MNTFEKAKIKIREKFSNLTLLNYSGYFNNASFLDSEFGEFVAKYQSVYSGTKIHPERLKKQIKNNAFIEAFEKLQNKHKNLILLEYNGYNKKAKCFDTQHGEFYGIYSNILMGRKNPNYKLKYAIQLQNIKPHIELIEYNGQKISKFVDKDYGEFEEIFSKVLKSAEHPTRLHLLKLKKYQDILNSKFDYLTIIDLSTNSKDISVFYDKEYGEFFGKFAKVSSGAIKHPERTKQNKYNATQIQKTKDKRKNTCLEKYNATTPFLNPDIAEKIKQTKLNLFGTEFVTQNSKILSKINKTKLKNNVVLNINGMTASEAYKYYNVQYSYTKFVELFKIIGLDAALNFKSDKTDIEHIISNILKNLNEPYIHNKKLHNSNYRPDFKLTNKMVIIEADGLKYHCDAYIKDQKYHLKKKQHYDQFGFDSLFFRSDEILHKTPIIKSIIMSHTNNIVNKYFARKCNIKKLSIKEQKQWFNENHLMGAGSGTTYGLIFENDILAAMSIVNKQEYLEINRFCNKLETIVVGGFSKLLKFTINELNPQKIISFVDSRYGNGNSLISCGFKETTNYESFKWTDFTKSFHRMKFRGNSGYDYNLYKIWDCGQKKFEMKVNKNV